MAKKQAYVVLVGVKPGVYTNWLDVTQYTTGVPHAQFQGFTYYDDAVRYFERAHRRGATRAVKKLPPPKDEDDSDDDEPAGPGGKRKEPEGRSNDGKRHRSREIEDNRRAAASVQTPSKGIPSGRAARDAQIAAALASARKNKIGPSASSPSVIASERRQQDRRPSSSRHAAALARSATEPAYHPQPPQVQDSPTVPARTSSRRTRRTTVELPSPEPDVHPRTRAEPETQSRTKPGTASESRGPTSDIATNETRRTNRFTNSPGLSTPPHPYRYAQSLSYASSPASMSLSSSDMRTHISSPSSFGTRYFPEDWLKRIGPSGQRRQSGNREGRHGGDDRSSVLSEYATAPNTPEMESTELEDNVEDMHNVTMASASPSLNPSARDRVGWSEPSSSSSRSAVTSRRSKTWPSAPPLPPATLTATATEVISSPSATSTPRRTGSTSKSASVNDRFPPSLASVSPSSPAPLPEPSKKGKKKSGTRVTRSLSEAQVQTDSPPPTRRRKNPEASVQTTPPGPSPPKRQHLDNQVQTSPVASPARESTAVGDVPVRPLPGAFPCACEHPEYACINCGQRPRIEEHSASPAAGRSRSATRRSSPTITTTASPARSELSSVSVSASSLPVPFGTPAAGSAVPSSPRSHGRTPSPSVSSAPSSPAPSGTPASATPSSVISKSSSSSSSRSRGGHTPIMGASETRAYSRSPTARIQESLTMMSFSEAALGVGEEAVVHDVSFDPRSPIQRGTSIPAGTSGSAVRPSPAMAPVPMGSLGLLFPPPS